MERIGTAFLAAAVLSLVAMARPETKLEVKGVHICCPVCEKAIVKKVEGVDSDDTKPKETTFTVKGNFDAAKLVKALNDGGLHVKVSAK